MQKTISIDNTGGNVFGYVSDDLIHLNNFLERDGISFSNIRNQYSEWLDDKFAILKSLHVAEEFRNQGFGTDLVDAFIDETLSSDASIIFLIVDVDAENEFDLTAWYEGFDFEKFVDTNLMVRVK